MNSDILLPILIDLQMKGVIVLSLAFLAGAVLRRYSAAVRHVLWLMTVVVLLLLPVTELVDPQWSFAWNARDGEQPPLSAGVLAAGKDANASAMMVPGVVIRSDAGRTFDWSLLVLVTWVSGVGVLVGLRVASSIRLRVLVRASRPVSGARVCRLADEAFSGVRVELRECSACGVPFVFGIFRPTVFLPRPALDWSEDRLMAALRHEFAHVMRCDCVSRVIMDMACAIYWMNPLVWFMRRAMCLAQEQACDDEVLAAGSPASDYANQLVEVVRNLRGARFDTRPILAMAQPSTLEVRVRAIVDERCDRRRAGRLTHFCGGCALVVALLGCSLVQLEGAERKERATVADRGKKTERGRQIVVDSKFLELSGPAPELLAVVPSLKSRKAKSMVTGVFAREKAADIQKAIETSKHVDTLSSPRVVVQSGQNAVVQIGREMRYPVDWRKDQKTGAWEPKTFGTKTVGITFKIVATVKPGGGFDLKLNPEVVRFMGFADLDAGNGKSDFAVKPSPLDPADPKEAVPNGHRAQARFATRSLNAHVAILPGQTVLLEIGAPPQDKNAPRQLVLMTVDFAAAPSVKPEAGNHRGEARRTVVTSQSATFDRATGTLTAEGEVVISTTEATIKTDRAEIAPLLVPVGAGGS